MYFFLNKQIIFKILGRFDGFFFLTGLPYLQTEKIQIFSSIKYFFYFKNCLTVTFVPLHACRLCCIRGCLSTLTFHVFQFPTSVHLSSTIWHLITRKNILRP